MSMDLTVLPRHTLQVEARSGSRVDLRIRDRWAGSMSVVTLDAGEFSRALALGKQGVEVPVEILNHS